MKNEYLITAAGGNGTAIRVLDRALSREEYEREGKKLGNSMESLGAEQSGFLILPDDHLEMSGGEFCGNASRAVAVLLYKLKGVQEFRFTVSGFKGIVSARVEDKGSDHYRVRCEFPALPTNTRKVFLSTINQEADVVDLGGIVHVIINGQFSADREKYESLHRSITHELEFSNRSAVGVDWYERTSKGVVMHPVVWVRGVDTFFYEQSCGSGAISVAKVTGEQTVIQPTGLPIHAQIGHDLSVLESEMEVTHAH